MQSPGPGLNIPVGSTVPVVVPIPTYQKKTNNYVTALGQQASVVPAIVTTPSYSLLETQTTPGANLTPSQPVITAIPAGLIPSAPQPSAVPQVNVHPTYKTLGSQTTAGVSLLPVFTQSQAIGPLANYINKDTTFWSSGNAPATNSFSTLFVSSLTAGNASISTLYNSTIITTSINIDGQTLDADSDQLFLNGIPIATTANLSSIADWSLYDSVSTVRFQGNNITGVGTIDANGGKINYIFASSISTEVVAALNDVRTPMILLYNELLPNIDLTMVPSGDKSRLEINTSTVAYINDVEEWASYPALANVDASTITTSTITAKVVGLVGSTGNGSLTTSADGSSLLFNGSTIAQQSQISSIADWSLFPSISTIQANNPIYNASGRLVLQGQGIDIGALGTLPSGSTNTIKMRSGDIELLSDGGGGFNVATGLNLAAGAGFALSGGAGGAITTGLILLIQAGGALGLSAAGAVTMQAAGACSMAAAGPVNIGSQAYTSLETIRIDNSLITRDTSTSDRLRIRDVQELQGNNTGGGGSGRLDILGNGVTINISSSAGIAMNAENSAGIGVPLIIRADGTTGSGIGTQFFTLEQKFNPSSQTFLYDSRTTNLTGIFPPITVARNSVNVNALTTSSLTHTMSETYDGQSTITYANSQGPVNITGITNLTAGTINTTSLGLQNLTASSIQVSSIVGNEGSFSTLLTNASTIRLGGNFPGVSLPLGRNSIGIGYASQPAGSNSVGIGYNAGKESGIGNVFIGQEAGYGAGNYNVGIGFRAHATSGNSGTVVLNATSSFVNPVANNSCYIKPLRNVSTQPAATAFAMGYTSATGELTVANTKINEIESTIHNTQQISYDTGLLTTTIGGILQGNQALFTQAVSVDTTLDILQTANISSLQLYGIANTSAPNALFYNSTTTKVSYAPITTIVAEPAFVYYVATNGRAGARGTITDPLSTIAEALTKPAKTGAVDPPGMIIYVAPGAYTEDITIPVSLTLPSVSIIGMSNDTDDSKQVQIRGSVTVTGTDVTLVNTVNSVVINNIAVFAKNTGLTTAISMTGRGYRVYLQNGLYTSPVAISVPLISLAGTNGLAGNATVQLVINNCSLSCVSGSTGNIVSVSGGQLFEIKDSDLTQRGTTALALGVTGGTFSSANNSNFEGAGAAISLAFTAAGLANFTNCLIRGVASPTVAILTLGANANLNLSNNTIQNTNTTEANNTSRYVYVTAAGLLIASIRNNFSSSATSPITQMTPYQATTASLALYYFANIYTNAQNSIEENLPVWAAVRQFSNDILVPQFQVVATSATPIALNASVRGRTYLLTGTTTQPFTTTGLTATDAGFAVIVHNGNASGGGDINITGATGTTIIHNRTATANGGVLYLYWTGAALIGY